jgi:hypothetical protein
MARIDENTQHGIWGRRFFFVGLNLAAFASVIGLAYLLTVAVQKVREGRGFETYRTFWLVEFNYIGVLVLFGVLLVVAPVCVWLWWREERQWRDLERKYGVRQDV